MYPNLLTIGGVTFPAYFVLVAFAYVQAVYLAARIGRFAGLRPVDFVDLGIFAGGMGFVGARVFHILFEMPAFYWQHPLAIFKFWYGGFVLYGGLIVGVLAGIYFVHRRKVPLWHAADLVVVPIALAVAIGRLGCFLAGCCYGKPTFCDWPISVVFHLVDYESGQVAPQAQPLATPLYATQIYCAVLCIAIAFGAIWWRRRKRVHGEVAALAMLSYSLGRYVIEFFRNDLDRGVYLQGWLSTSQFISMIVAGLGLWIFVLRRRSWRARAANTV